MTCFHSSSDLEIISILIFVSIHYIARHLLNQMYGVTYIGVVTGLLGDADNPSMLASNPSSTYIGDDSNHCASPNQPP